MIHQHSLITDLSAALQMPLPGFEAQLKMSHPIRREAMMSSVKNAKKAAVLILLYEHEDGWHFPLIQRQSNKNDRHSGQISLPGGKFEPSDQSLEMTAVREAEEELGIRSQDVEVIGQLTELYIMVSNFLVQPYIGVLPYTPTFIAQETEVHSIIPTPFDLILQEEVVQTTDMTLSHGMMLTDVPYFNIYGNVVWGATAMILSELKEIHQQGVATAY